MPTLRALGAADLDLICRQREAMFREAGTAAGGLDAMAAPFRRWLRDHLEQKRYFGFVAQDGERPIGGVGLMVIDWPPHPMHPADERRGYILNLFVEPDHRRMGVARMLLDASERALRSRGIAYAVLHATDAGRPLYQRRGWTGTSEMAKHLGSIE